MRVIRHQVYAQLISVFLDVPLFIMVLLHPNNLGESYVFGFAILHFVVSPIIGLIASLVIIRGDLLQYLLDSIESIIFRELKL